MAQCNSAVRLDEQPKLWAARFDRFGQEALADFDLYTPLETSAEHWSTAWVVEPVFLALSDGAVIDCAGLDRDTDRPERGQYALTAVRRDWRGRGIASHLKRRTSKWAADNGLTEM